MARRKKVTHVMAVIEQRIRQGDYVLHPIPGERKIADETGVSHMTARKAVRGLLERKVLIRRPNGSLEVYPRRQGSVGAAHFLLLYPAYASTYLTHLRQTVGEAADQYGLNMRPVQYVHWDDPVVPSAAANPAGLIFIPSAVEVPSHVLTMLRSSKCVSLDLDLSEQEVPSITLFPDSHIIKVFEHLRQLGHRRISCISTQHLNPEIERRIRLWRQWLREQDLAGELLERSTRSFADATPTAYDVMNELLAKGSMTSTAFVGTTFPAAVGAMRACWERGLVVGQNVSICAINIEKPARFMTPSITGLDTPNLSKLLARCFDWFTNDAPWSGGKRLEPAKAEFVQGESTGAVRTPA
ncbi:MAG TPA: substrate-binding domain-containing protein [Tepidisphaeraceae bacterium]|nr:substrate-binding domain-containing protein [Tepidisphaeraceae bacterium]